MKILIGLVLLLADTSGRASAPRGERLGNSYAWVGPGEDRGLAVEVWWNETLERAETWHKPADGRCFLRLPDGAYVLGVHDGTGWKTVPPVRLAR